MVPPPRRIIKMRTVKRVRYGAAIASFAQLNHLSMRPRARLIVAKPRLRANI